jgi:hypothetical protein
MVFQETSGLLWGLEMAKCLKVKLEARSPAGRGMGCWSLGEKDRATGFVAGEGPLGACRNEGRCGRAGGLGAL